MPRVSAFYGILIYLYYNDHLPPHFHAEYAEYEATFVIETMDYLKGELPRRARTLVLEWVLLHRDELRENWELARQGLPLNQIDPLD